MDASTNPYAPPQTAAGRKPPVFVPGHVTLAAFLGSPLAGAALMALNERRLGRQRAVVPTAVAGVIATVLLFALGLVLPERVPSAPFAVAAAFATGAVARLRQHQAVQAYLSDGGKRASGWVAAGIGLGTLVVVLSVVFAIVFALGIGE